jgi:CHAT domain-containing protein
VQALRTLGLNRRAQQQIEQIIQILEQQPDGEAQARAWLSLGNTLQALGQWEESRQAFNQSLTIATSLASPNLSSAVLISLGNDERAAGDRRLDQALLETQAPLGSSAYCPLPVDLPENMTFYDQALKHYTAALEKTEATQIWVEAKLNQLSLKLKMGESILPDELQSLQNRLDTLPPSRSTLYAKINYAKTIACLEQPLPQPGSPGTQQAMALFQQTIAQAQQIQDRRAQSYALGNLGQLEQILHQRAIAQQHFTAALGLSQQIQAPEIAYQWQWQIGRLLHQDHPQKALRYYQTAFELLKDLRGDIVALNASLQFSFRENVEPVYREYVELLLEKPNQQNLRQARSAIEALQLAELDNFFRDACAEVEPELLDNIVDQEDQTAAVLYPIILPNRLAIILKLPQQQQLQYYATPLPESEVRTKLIQLQTKLAQPENVDAFLAPVYDWLIRPVIGAIAAHDQQGYAKIDTLVFVSDGLLRNIPMAALYDGENYLIDQYAVVLAPGLQMLKSKTEDTLPAALIGGLSLPQSGFLALPEVATELNAVQSILNTRKVLLDETFTRSTIEQEVRSTPISIVHLATHGQFSSQAEETFILVFDDRADSDRGDRIDINQLQELLQNRESNDSEEIALLVLSACETAKGDARAALGLSGMAIRAGARSTLATLWKADSRVTAQLLPSFYQQLYQSQPNLNKAEALQAAQKALRHEVSYPSQWATFVLLGNWL